MRPRAPTRARSTRRANSANRLTEPGDAVASDQTRLARGYGPADTGYVGILRPALGIAAGLAACVGCNGRVAGGPERSHADAAAPADATVLADAESPDDAFTRDGPAYLLGCIPPYVGPPAPTTNAPIPNEPPDGCDGPLPTSCGFGGPCDDGGCCVAGICVPQGVHCANNLGVCAEGSCSGCGAVGQPCCQADIFAYSCNLDPPGDEGWYFGPGCTDTQALCACAGPQTGFCMACGDVGQPCCWGSACGDSLVCGSDGTCTASCGAPGEICCGNYFCGDSGLCAGFAADIPQSCDGGPDVCLLPGGSTVCITRDACGFDGAACTTCGAAWTPCCDGGCVGDSTCTEGNCVPIIRMR
jgi:hypothetical protein